MKLKNGFLILMCICTTSLVFFTACSKDDDDDDNDDNGGGTVTQEEAVACFTSEYDAASFAFNSECSENADGFEWDFGDGTTSMMENPSHGYSETGTYTVTLTVTGPGGDTDSSSEEIEVTEDEVQFCIECICTVGGQQQTITQCGTEGEVNLLCYNCDQQTNCYCEE